MVSWSAASPANAHTISTRIELHTSGLRMATAVVDGVGSHMLDVRADANEVEISIDGVPVERTGGYFIKRLGINSGIDNDGDLLVDENRRGGPLKLHISPRTISRTTTGESGPPPQRIEANGLGEEWRKEPIGPNDVERLYRSRDAKPRERRVGEPTRIRSG